MVYQPDGSEHKPLTSGKNYYSQVSWSSDSKRIAYTSNEEGKSQIFVRWMDTGSTSSITNLTSAASNLQWSPDGNMILFTGNIEEPMPVIGKIPAPPVGATWATPAKVIRHVGYKKDGAPIHAGESYTQLFIVQSEGGAVRALTSKRQTTISQYGRLTGNLFSLSQTSQSPPILISIMNVFTKWM